MLRKTRRNSQKSRPRPIRQSPSESAFFGKYDILTFFKRKGSPGWHGRGQQLIGSRDEVRMTVVFSHAMRGSPRRLSRW